MQRVGNIIGALRGNRFLALAVVLLLLVSVWRFTPLGKQIPIGGISQTIEKITAKVGGSPPTTGPSAKGEKEPAVTGTSKPSVVSVATEKGKDLAGRAATASGTVLNTPTKQVGTLFRNMSLWQSVVLAVIVGVLLRRGVLPWFANLTLGQAIAAGQAVDHQARRAPILQWLVYISIGLGIVGIVIRSVREGVENLFTVALSAILPMLVVAAVFAISPKVKDELNRVAQATVGVVGPLFDLVRLILLVYFGGSWAMAIPWGSQVANVSAMASTQPRPISTVLDWATMGVRLANTLAVNDFVMYAGLVFFAFWATGELAPRLRGAP